MRHITLRPYQVEKIEDDIIKYQEVDPEYEDKLVVFEAATGAGKTLMQLVASALLIEMGISEKIMIVPPSQNIEEGFVPKDENGNQIDVKIIFPQEDGEDKIPDLIIRKELIKQCREQDETLMCDSIQNFFNSNEKGIFVLTQQALLCHYNKCLDNPNYYIPEHLDTYKLVADEAHRAGAKGLSGVIRCFRSRGSGLGLNTATYYRMDNKDFRGDLDTLENPLKFRKVSRTLAEHMADEGRYCPTRLHLEIIGISMEDLPTEAEIRGDNVEKLSHRKLLINDYIKAYEKYNHPKTMIKLLSGAVEGDSVNFSKEIKAAFEAAYPNIRVLNGVGKDIKTKNTFIREITKECEKKYDTSQWDIVLGINRIKEGTDWSVCSHVFCTGVPSSIGNNVQLSGRTMRKKGENHPYKEDAYVSYFVLGANHDLFARIPTTSVVVGIAHNSFVINNKL